MGLNIFKSKEAKSVDLQAALESIDLTQFDAAIEAARSARQAALLDGTDREITDAEKALADARLASERGHARHAELTRRLAEAQAKESRDALIAEFKDVSKRADDLALRLGSEYRKHAGALIEVLTELNSLEAEVKAVNAKADAAGLLDSELPRIPQVEPRVFAWSAVAQFDSILINTRLKEFVTASGHPDRSQPLWPSPEFKFWGN